MSRPVLSNPCARHLFLACHALADAPRGPSHGAHLGELIDRIGFIQVDSINTVERAHHMILWSRRQTFRPAALKTLLEHDRALFEHWTHDASILPMPLFPYWKHRFAKHAARLHDPANQSFRERHETQFGTILDRIARDGPVGSADVGEGEPRGKGGWWDWHPSKTALEWLWRAGQISVTRRDGFRKIYDLTERVIPPDILRQTVDGAELVEWACASALDRLGFADESEIARYWCAVDKADVIPWVAVEIAGGRLLRVDVTQADGSARPALIRPWVLEQIATLPAPPARPRILSPFDPALRDRARVERLFGFHYRIEVFVPEPKRRYGYYVFPVLEGTRLIGRLDAKAHRAEGRLHLRAFWPEAGVKMGQARVAGIMQELARLADFSGCAALTIEECWLRDHPRV